MSTAAAATSDFSPVKVSSVFDLEEEEQGPFTYNNNNNIRSTSDSPSVDISTKNNNQSNQSPQNKFQKEFDSSSSPSAFLNGIDAQNSTFQPSTTNSSNSNSTMPPPQPQIPQVQVKPSQDSQENNNEFMPSISPTFMLSSMATSSPATESLLSNVKERLNAIRPWKDFFALDQFRIPESSTAAQSRASHNFSHFQNNYLIILLLLLGFSLLSNLSLLMVAAVIMGGFYYLSTLNPEYTLKLGNQEITLKQIALGWSTVSILLLYLTSALSTVFWILSVAAIITIAHASLHDIAIENEFNSV